MEIKTVSSIEDALDSQRKDSLTGSEVRVGSNSYGYYDGQAEYGNPDYFMQFLRKQHGNNCSIEAQAGVLSALGIYLTEDEAAYYGQIYAGYDPNGGTPIENGDALLNAFGIKTYEKYEATIDDLVNALTYGFPLVALDAYEIWQPYRDASGYPIEQQTGAHAVWVTGFDIHQDGSWSILCNDSGTGQFEAIDYWDFMNAWSDLSNYMAVAYT